MKLNIKKRMTEKSKKRMKNKVKIRKKVSGTPERPRLTVFRSGYNTYAQLIDDSAGKTLAAASTKSKGESISSKSSVDAAKTVGALLAKKAMEKNIKNIVFDRSGYLYHGRVKAVAEGAREGGLNF